jgi:ribonuclease E
MTMRMLIDARHREETRVAVVKGNRIEEFDFESAEHLQLKGNIYLAKVTRVEPSLQAAFIDYGGGRHGFLAFSEIHPDYYQIPKEDREALLREEAEHAAEEERLRAGEDHDDDDHHHHDDEDEAEAPRGHDDDDGEHEDGDEAPPPAPSTASGNGIDEGAAENLRQKRMNLRRRYKIQDVIRRRQVLLVQVVKEERGNKGAAMTTYLSLAGRYCVLMPNTSHGGGISRKISNGADRKRLKVIMAELNLPKTMGCIVRTAGLQRTKVEIRRDFDYLARLWDEIREKTLSSAAPALVYQDSDLIKRAIRDLYNKDIDEVIVEGDEGYRHAKEFMKLLMPSHARRVQPYADAVPLFQRNHVEEQLQAMYQPVVQLKSGGYLVINPTEALVSIDINSGRSTREHGIEATAVGTNLEAAHEIARQLRLRDMAGLVVIDFIDMENNGNIRKVEKAMKAALADDRARIQVGRISSFGLMEMSRQRLRTGVLEASTRQCPHCEGTGLVRTASSAGLSALRMLEDEAGRGRGSLLTLRASSEAAFYVLNRKRHELAEIEERFGVRIEIASDGEVEGARMTVEASGPPPAFTPKFEAPPVYEDDDDDIIEDEADEEVEVRETRAERPRETQPREDREEGEGGPRRRRRRGRRGRREEGEGAQGEPGVEGDTETEPREAREPREPHEPREPRTETAEEGEARRSRRGRRGGRRRRGRDGAADGTVEAERIVDGVDAVAVEEAPAAEPVVEEKPKRTRKRPAARDAAEPAPEAVVKTPVAEKPKRASRAKAKPVAEPAPVVAVVDEPVAKPKRASRAKAKAAVEDAPAPEPESPPALETASDEPRRGGWWQRTFGATE